MRALGFEPKKEEIQKMISDVDASWQRGSGPFDSSLRFAQVFLMVVKDQLPQSFSPQENKLKFGTQWLTRYGSPEDDGSGTIGYEAGGLLLGVGTEGRGGRYPGPTRSFLQLINESSSTEWESNNMAQEKTLCRYMQEFLKMMTHKILNRDPKDEILKAFRLFDDDETGKISFKNLKRVAKELGERMTDEERRRDEELQEMIDEADRDGDGEVNEEEFLRIMKKTPLGDQDGQTSHVG
ncbi:unnamed protein product [Durusdinium trenchii]|uniref:EF-hand domain-containing protein n=1 Tax=Durusdinium trenchii TaxID=1381693 RepID=A0ABP0NJM7_9DINO